MLKKDATDDNSDFPLNHTQNGLAWHESVDLNPFIKRLVIYISVRD
ncbi:hypothetical protein ykris0001_39160 [Yersinia kristensenii ATCC 33638]|nr:hypothetical protein ykris0001_39160 [Yersinia kristensenii ATCC 33638]